jgi:hypothetical protein
MLYSTEIFDTEQMAEYVIHKSVFFETHCKIMYLIQLCHVCIFKLPYIPKYRVIQGQLLHVRRAEFITISRR